MSVGFWVVLAVVIFIIGNVMALKPKISEVRLGQMRLFARKINLNPKLLPTPDFIATSAKMTLSHTLIDDTWRLPLVQFVVKDGKWHNDTPHPKLAHLSGQSIDHALASYFLGLAFGANSVSLYWQDEQYIRSFGARDDNAIAKMEQDLTSLKTYLMSLVPPP